MNNIFNLTKSQAIDYMKKGRKIKHRFFLHNEWITMKDGMIVFESGQQVEQKDFWQDRRSSGFRDGYMLYDRTIFDGIIEGDWSYSKMNDNGRGCFYIETPTRQIGEAYCEEVAHLMSKSKDLAKAGQMFIDCVPSFFQCADFIQHGNMRENFKQNIVGLKMLFNLALKPKNPEKPNGEC